MIRNYGSALRLAAGAVLVLLLALAAPVNAHEGENGPHGGPMLEVSEHHVELTATGGELTLYLMDAAHKPVSSKGASGRVVVLEGSKQASLTLEAREPDRLTAKLEAPLNSGARVVVTAKLADGRSLVGRFVWK